MTLTYLTYLNGDNVILVGHWNVVRNVVSNVLFYSFGDNIIVFGTSYIKI